MKESSSFVKAAETSWDAMTPGVRRQVLGHGTDLMIVRVEFEAGAVGALHHHPHRQASYVANGRFEVSVGDARSELVAGDCFYASADVPHGVRAIEAGTLIDVFTPIRVDFLGPRLGSA
jgi:quercetin dioxygenase-like cupin family protein